WRSRRQRRTAPRPGPVGSRSLPLSGPKGVHDSANAGRWSLVVCPWSSGSDYDKPCMGAETEREILTVDGREIAISNPHKVLLPQAGHTKLDLAKYYLAVADGALRSAGGRPNVLVRYPNGVGGEFFYQKRAPSSRPSWI